MDLTYDQQSLCLIRQVEALFFPVRGRRIEGLHPFRHLWYTGIR
jgi:hypothetical protein